MDERASYLRPKSALLVEPVQKWRRFPAVKQPFGSRARILPHCRKRGGTCGHGLHQADVRGGQRPVVTRLPQVRNEALLRVPLAPLLAGRVVKRQARDDARPRRAEGVRARGVQPGEARAEPGRRLRRGRPGGSSSMTSRSSATPSTRGTGTARALASQRSPFASAANAAGCTVLACTGPGAAFANTARPSASVAVRWS